MTIPEVELLKAKNRHIDKKNDIDRKDISKNNLFFEVSIAYLKTLYMVKTTTSLISELR